MPSGVASPAASANVHPFLPANGAKQTTNISTSPAPRLDPIEPVCDPPEQVIQPSDPRGKIVLSQHKTDNLHHQDHKVLLEYLATSHHRRTGSCPPHGERAQCAGPHATDRCHPVATASSRRCSVWTVLAS